MKMKMMMLTATVAGLMGFTTGCDVQPVEPPQPPPRTHTAPPPRPAQPTWTPPPAPAPPMSNPMVTNRPPGDWQKDTLAAYARILKELEDIRQGRAGE